MKNYIYRWMQWAWFGNAHNKKYSQWPFFAGTGWIVWDGVKWKSVSPPPFVYDPITETYTVPYRGELNDNAYAEADADNDLDDPPKD
jgi:hypothetical protein